MYCSSCGQAIQPGMQFCPGCGRAALAPPPAGFVQAAAPGYLPMRVHRNLQTLGVLWLVYAGWTLVGWLIALPFLSGLVGRWSGGSWGPHAFSMFPQMNWLIPFVTVLIVARSILSAVTGIGLMRRASWGRTLALITGFLTLIKPITGTVLAIYTLWVLLPAPSAQEYEQIAMS